MPDTIKISELDEALAIADAAEFPYTQENGGELTTFKAPLTQIAAKVVEDMSYAGINLPVGAGVKSVENTLNYLLGAVGGNPNENIATEYDPTDTYAKGDYVIYENVLYICTDSDGTTGTFDPTAWSQTELAEHTAQNTANFGTDYDENTTYNTGDKCVYNNLLYECNDDGVTGTWDGSKWDSLTVAGMTDNNLPHYTGTPTAGTTAEAIGDLSTLTTTDKSSLVGAVNEVNANKADKTAFTKKTYTTTNAINIGANTIDTQTIAINDANFGIVVGFAITNNTDVVIMQCYFNSTTELVLRVRNVSASAGTYKFSIIYI